MQNITFQSSQQEFWKTLRYRTSIYFLRNNISKYANAHMYFKIFFMLSLFIAPFFLLMYMELSGITQIILCVVMGIGMAGIGFNISHQAAHDAISGKPWVNRLFSLSFNLVGMSDYIWKIKHNVFHHAYTNVYEMDEALKEGDVMRLSYDAPYKSMYRFQHIYGILVYALFTVFWAFVLDFEKLKRYNAHGAREKKSHPAGEVILFFATKIYYICIAFILPHYVFGFSWLQVITGFLIVHVVASLLITHVLQVEHLAEEIAAVSPDAHGNVNKSWAQNQLEGTCNFYTWNKVFNWYIGGCNYQIEHHLFPQICSIHYPAISEIVRTTAHEFGLQYICHDSFGKALVSHYKQLQSLGQNPLSLSSAA